MIRSRAVVVMIAALCTGPALAQSFPARPIRMIVPYPAGGGIDIVARLVAQPMAAALGQPVLVENQSGAATMIGTGMVARAPADGHTILFTSNGFAVNVMLHKNPSYKVADFAAVAPVVSFPYVMLIAANMPVRTVAELVDYAKREPSKVNAATVGQGSAIHLLNERFEAAAGVTIADVHYRGTAPALADLIAGQVQILFDTIITAAPQARSGKARALAVTAPARSALLPDVPTFREAGIGALTQGGWMGIFAPAATPRPILERLAREAASAAASEAARARFERDGLAPLAMSPEAFAAFVREDAEPWERTLKALDIRIE